MVVYGHGDTDCGQNKREKEKLNQTGKTQTLWPPVNSQPYEEPVDRSIVCTSGFVAFDDFWNFGLVAFPLFQIVGILDSRMCASDPGG